MEKIKFKRFNKISKWLVNYDKMNLLDKLIYNIKSPFKYITFNKKLNNGDFDNLFEGEDR